MGGNVRKVDASHASWCDLRMGEVTKDGLRQVCGPGDKVVRVGVRCTCSQNPLAKTLRKIAARSEGGDE